MKTNLVSIVAVFMAIVLLAGCAAKKLSAPQTKIITLDSEPRGAKVVMNGQVLCESTPAKVSIPLTYKTDNTGFKTPGKRLQNTQEMNRIHFMFIKDGYANGVESIVPDASVYPFVYPDAVFHMFKPAEKKPQAMSEKREVVTREAPGTTKMEDAIIRWYFDSDPRGARIFWRVISSVPAEVKNTNETYLTTTPYEETRGFNILGLTYDNSKDVTIEVKVQKRGYEEQVKRFNVRQALDQQEISGFFELVPKE